MANNQTKKFKLSDSSIKSYIQYSKQIKKISCKPLNKIKFNNEISFDSKNLNNKTNLKTDVNEFSNLPPITPSHNISSEKPYKTININNSYKKKSTLSKNLNKALNKPILMDSSFLNHINNNNYNDIIHQKNKTKIINHKKINSMKANNTKTNELNTKIKEYYTLMKNNNAKKTINNSTSFRNNNIFDNNNNKIKKLFNNSMNNRHKRIKLKEIDKSKLNSQNIKEKKKENNDNNFNKINELLSNNYEYNNRNNKINSIKIETLQTFSKEEINNSGNSGNSGNDNNICKTDNYSNPNKPTIKVNLNESIKNEPILKSNNNKFNKNKSCEIPMTTKNNINNKYNKLNYIFKDLCTHTHKNKFCNKSDFKQKNKKNMNKSFIINKNKIYDNYDNGICLKNNKNRMKCNNSTVYRKKKNESFEIAQKNSDIFEVIPNIQVKSINEYEQEHKIKENDEIIKSGNNNDIDNKNNININININYNNININKDNNNHENIEDKEEYDFYLKENFSKDRFSFKPSDESQDLISNYQKLTNSNKLQLEKQDFDNAFLCNANLIKPNNGQKTKKIAVYHTRININKIKNKPLNKK